MYSGKFIDKFRAEQEFPRHNARLFNLILWNASVSKFYMSEIVNADFCDD